MSGIVLSASVRQNLLALQNTASLLATTQNNLATGNKVNTALDNPTEFFTAQSLNNRASDIANLLDSIGNGVQVLQAANTGLTSLQKLVDSAKSIASQVLQAPTGYTTKSSVTSAVIPGATANNLLGSSSNKFVVGSAVNNDNTTPAAITGTTRLSGTPGTSSNDLASSITTGDTLTVNGVVFTFVAGSVSAGTNIGVGDTVSNLLAAIDSVTGATATPSSVTGGQISVATGTAQDLTISGTALAKLGLTAGTTTRNPPALSGQTLTIASTGGGVATNITFGTGASQISTLAQLNTALATNNLQASLSTTGQLTILTTNEAASSTIGAVAGSSTAASQAFNGVTASTPVADTNSQTTRAGLIAQYNNVLAQINTTAQDASFNGINLLNGDTLKLTFNETGRSTLNITGVTFNSTGLGLSALVVGTDFLDSNSANKVLTTLNSASTAIRSEASSLGSNLSIVQIRQDFNKNLINVLQTGSSNLTLADTNEEAANSQALSTRQSIAVSALALANQSQASVLQLLR
ncbi:putative flagellin protein, C-terminus fljN [Bradyrhizobium sp. ORS 285]|uniref:flagellin N-terminal helical domain-containing protein n=1 Tax=Bradyrhizobium sp. ORS 285 TaxID=115808 RepID=UPI0002407F0C|nr:flagellin [Bradyrhizobium sp. ORS 285]CCD89085.1 putative flagellin protein, C-terminus [Bradyrhizobium sp. ORS 285]SMX57319.1 putative flagellin protein, C-terminus fljN [Bradyrhizobium sp. ORS 285]